MTYFVAKMAQQRAVRLVQRGSDRLALGIIEGFRGALLTGTAPDPLQLSASAIGVMVVWAIAWPLFRYLSRYFADVL